jgi:hypothetical protein
MLLWASFGEEEKAWVNINRLVGMFEIEWKTPHHNILVEFFKNWRLNPTHNIIKVMLGDEQRTIDKHVLVEVFRICHTRKIETN